MSASAGALPASPAATPAAPRTPTPAALAVYTVQAGDTLLAIAERYGVSVADLVAANGLADPDVLAIGQVLVIPASGPVQTTPSPAEPPVNPEPIARPAEPFVYRVQAGDTLLTLSARYGVSVADLVAANNLASADAIAVDQVLLVPVGGLSVAATGSFVHRVEPGDTLSGLALRYGVSVADIMALNRLASADALVVGQDVRIPTVATVPAATPEPPTPQPAAETPAPEVPTPTPAPAPVQGTLEQYRAWMDEAHGTYPYAESTDMMWAVMMCESGGNAAIVGGGTYYGLFQYRQGTWAGAWNPYRDQSIFDARAQIFATAKAWLEGHQAWWRGCWPS